MRILAAAVLAGMLASIAATTYATAKTCTPVSVGRKTVIKCK